MTLFNSPPVTFSPISALMGTPFFPLAGVTETASGPTAAFPLRSVPAGADDAGALPTHDAGVVFCFSPHATSANGAATATVRIATSRLPTIFVPVRNKPRAHCAS
ncbi:hypothetical protein [Jidongwangia harbinensis]|uniref:hypothetical protein n=1 Tax=Jidongwangia harbinensis TaxID=2878561 RepID=UPI003558230E